MLTLGLSIRIMSAVTSRGFSSAGEHLGFESPNLHQMNSGPRPEEAAVFVMPGA